MTEDVRLVRLEEKVDTLTESVSDNQLELLKLIESLRSEYKTFQLEQMERIHAIDKQVQSHNFTFDAMGKVFFGGALSSLCAAVIYFKDTFFPKH
jgi:hypothetical protein